MLQAIHRIFKLLRIRRPAPLPINILQVVEKMPIAEPATPSLPEVESFSNAASISPVPDASIHFHATGIKSDEDPEFDAVEFEDTEPSQDQDSEFDSVEFEVSEPSQDQDPTSELADSQSEAEDDADDAQETNQVGRYTFNISRIDGEITDISLHIPSRSGITVYHHNLPIATKNNSSKRGSAPSTRTGPTCGPSTTISGRSPNTCHGKQYDLRNASTASTGSGSSTGTSASNRSAAFGGDRPGNRASGYTVISDVQILSVGGNIYLE